VLIFAVLQALLLETKKKAKTMGIELRGRLFSKENLCSSNKIKNAEKENIQKMIKLESKVNAQIESNKECSGESCKYGKKVVDVDFQTQGHLKCIIELYFSEKSVIHSTYLISAPSYFSW
jgi:ribosomal protein S8